MKFRQLDNLNDWTFGKGQNNYVRKNDAIALNIKTRLYSWLGDCFFAVDEGIDWYNRLGSKNQRELLEADLRTTILQSEGVTGIIDFFTTLNAEDRAFRAQYNITTIYSSSFEDLIKVGI
jgi:hypothetical protein